MSSHPQDAAAQVRPTGRSVCIVIGGHITCCPRMMKMAVALAETGHAVSIVNPIYGPNMFEPELRFLRDARWRSAPVKMVRRLHPWTYYRTGGRLKLARAVLRRGNLGNFSLAALGRGYTRAFDELLAHALAQPADLYLGGTAGGLAVAARAAELRGVPFALDLEDFHSAEQEPGPEADLSHAVIAEIERRLLPRAAFLTGGSGPICQAYFDTYRVRVETINNTFHQPQEPPAFAANPAGRLRLFWFSQVIGLQRGLEGAVQAIGLAGVPGELHLLGHDPMTSLKQLTALADQCAPRLTVVHHLPVRPDAIVELGRQFDVGLSLEPGFSKNNEIALSNKSFTYLQAGLAVAFTDTLGQRPLAHDIGPEALLFKPGDTEAFAAGLRRWAQQPDALLAAKRAAWAAAARRWHWEHPEERGKALKLVEQVLTKSSRSVRR